MDRVIREQDLIVETGRASEGRTFVRVIHLPTGTDRKIVGLGQRSHHEIVAELMGAVVLELLSLEWIHEPTANIGKKASVES